MSDSVPADPSPSASGLRVGHAERKSAVTALRRHHEAGRLDEAELRERSERALAARTEPELDALFRDLPMSEPAPSDDNATGATPPAAPTPAAPASDTPATTRKSSHGVLDIAEPYATTIVAIVPFLALILFFVTGTWVWFLGIPIVALLIYGPEGREGTGPETARRRRDRNST